MAARTTSRNIQRLLILGTLLSVGAGLVAYGQVDSGQIYGVVKDQTGAVIPGATVTLTNEGTAASLTKVTGSDASYVFTPVIIGTYSISAEAKGFQKLIRAHIPVEVQQRLLEDFELTPGTASSSIEVTGNPVLLQTQDASVGQVVTTRNINNLPLNGRNYTFLAQIVAGVTGGVTDDRGLNRSGSFSTNGNRSAENNYILDGIDNNNYLNNFNNGTFFALLPPVDAISEFKVETNNYTAELGRAAGAVLNATIKSGTNQFHGAAWEFLRNDKLDAADFFENSGGIQKGEFRQNQFGFTFGGPLWLPKIYNGRNKTFFFVDYQGTRIRQGVTYTTTVPTAAERSSGYTNFSELLSDQTGSRTDLLGRKFPTGAIFDPETTRPVTAGQADPVTGLVATSNGYVRDSFPGNILPASRIDPNAVKLLNILPMPNAAGIVNNYVTNPRSTDDPDSFDVRVDQNFSEKDLMFGRFSFFDEPALGPSPFPGIADGDGNSAGPGANGIKFNSGRGAALSETHIFSPTMVNELRLGFSRLGNVVSQPNANTLGIPAQFGIPRVPQFQGNGGLPLFTVGGLSPFGSSFYMPVNRISQVIQVTENLTKTLKSHTVKGGFEWARIGSPWLSVPYSRGGFFESGEYTSVVNQTDASTGMAQLLLKPGSTSVPGGINNLGGADQVWGSDFSNHDQSRNYVAGYFEDAWKPTGKLTLTLGVRWEYFSRERENYGAAADFIPGTPFAGAEYVITAHRASDVPQSFADALSKDGIALVTKNSYTIGESEYDNFAPRFGFAYQINSKVVARGGYGIFYYGFEPQTGAFGTSAAFPFAIQNTFVAANAVTPITPNNSIGLLENGLLNVPLTAKGSTVAGIGLNVEQYRRPTPYKQGMNFTIQTQLSASTSLTVGYVGSLARHDITAVPTNVTGEILPPSANPQLYVPYPDFQRSRSGTLFESNSEYHSLQVTLERRFSQGLNFLVNYTRSTDRSDGREVDWGSNVIGGYRAPGLPGFGIQGDYANADIDEPNVFHFSGGYEFPFGQGRHFLGGSRGLVNGIAGGWSMNSILTLADGFPQTIACTTTTIAGMGCDALLVPGVNPISGDVNHYYNAAAFTNPPSATTIGQTDLTPLGGSPTQVRGPGYHRLDFSIFKNFKTSEATRLEFRVEVFNLTNTPQFSMPGSLNFLSPSTFAKITGTRDAPNDPREIQLALKLYW